MRTLLVAACVAAVMASQTAGEQNGRRAAYKLKPGDIVIVCTVFKGRAPGTTVSTPREPITYDPRFDVGARVERVIVGKSPWRVGDLVTFVIHSPTLMLGDSFSGRQFQLTLSPFSPRTDNDRVWFEPETRYLLQWAEPVDTSKPREP